MKNKFLIRFLTVAILLLVNCTIAMSQKTGFVGESQKVFLKGDSETIELGVEPVEFENGDADDAVYKWTIIEQPGGASFNHDFIAQPELTVTECGEHTIQCLRCSKYGYQTEIVIVDVIDEVEVVSIKPKYECFPVDTWTTIDDYVIETDPPGNEDVIELESSNSNRFLGNKGNSDFNYYYDIKFVGKRRDGTYYEPDVHECEVDVVNPNFSTKVAGLSVCGLIRSILATKGKLEAIDNKIKNFKLFKGMYSEPLFSIDFEPSFYTSADCCDHEEANLGLLTADITFKCGLQKKFPFAAFPFAGIEVKFFGQGTARLAQYPFLQNPFSDDKICRDHTPVTFMYSANLYGGVYAGVDGVLNDDGGKADEVFNASGGLNGYVAGELPIGVSGGVLRAGISLQINVVFIITVIALDMPIIEGIWPIE